MTKLQKKALAGQELFMLSSIHTKYNVFLSKERTLMWSRLSVVDENFSGGNFGPEELNDLIERCDATAKNIAMVNKKLKKIQTFANRGINRYKEHKDYDKMNFSKMVSSTQEILNHNGRVLSELKNHRKVLMLKYKELKDN